MFKICCLYNFDFPNIIRNSGATIYVDVNGNFFPDKAWYDLPLSVLDMWCWNMTRNSKPLKTEFELCFMDGPYYIKCLKDNNDLKLLFIDNSRDDDQILFEHVMTFEELMNAVYEAANKLVLTLTNHKVVKTPGLSSLKRRAKKLKKMKVKRPSKERQEPI